MAEKGKVIKQLHIRLPSEIYKKLKLKCVHEDISMQEYVAEIINLSLDNHTGQRENVGERNKE